MSVIRQRLRFDILLLALSKYLIDTDNDIYRVLSRYGCQPD